EIKARLPLVTLRRIESNCKIAKRDAYLRPRVTSGKRALISPSRGGTILLLASSGLLRTEQLTPIQRLSARSWQR
ncbi:MAG: hypothetical protein AAGK82_08920, partial [Pseudomonadota bacterium]